MLMKKEKTDYWIEKEDVGTPPINTTKKHWGDTKFGESLGIALVVFVVALPIIVIAIFN